MVLRGKTGAWGALLAVVTLAAGSAASAQGIERSLIGIRLNTTSKNVLSKYGNPSQIVVGEVGIRTPGQGGGGGGGQGGFGGGGGDFGGGGGYPGGGGGGYPGGGGGGLPAMGGFGGGGGGYPGGGGGGFPGAGGFPGGGEGLGGFGGGGGYPGGGGGGYPGGGGDIGGFGGGGGISGGTVGPFGQTTSTLARQQEVTWIYNRNIKTKGRNNLISYEFLIGPQGRVIQIRALGYGGGNVRTARGIGLGSTYNQVVRKYGFPEFHQNAGPVLIASYRSKHVSFQFLRNKVIAITVATVE